jgi:hypothetical protein
MAWFRCVCPLGEYFVDGDTRGGGQGGRCSPCQQSYYKVRTHTTNQMVQRPSCGWVWVTMTVTVTVMRLVLVVVVVVVVQDKLASDSPQTDTCTACTGGSITDGPGAKSVCSHDTNTISLSLTRWRGATSD